MCRIEPKVRQQGRGANGLKEAAIYGKLKEEKKRCKDDAVKLIATHITRDGEKPSTSKAAAAVSELAKKHLTVALTDHSNPLGRMTQEQWKVVEMRLLEALFAKIDADSSATMPTFDGTGWISGVKIIKCKDDPTLIWVKEAAYGKGIS
ncbi:uncharacterized protein LOC128869788 [Anastrepha ludens]|uniref:uncharacterized protein LOC128869788 n=1 Tax=Anastrepha ludens TaxID=28586 RepID=UPI0023B11E33|nr:uncharacterized protein LOC128869788 [Anastrepha ludens]